MPTTGSPVRLSTQVNLSGRRIQYGVAMTEPRMVPVARRIARACCGNFAVARLRYAVRGKR